MDIVNFAEEVCGGELPTWQKELLRRVDSLPKDCKLVYCLGRRRWIIAKESELSITSIVSFPKKGYHSRICLVDESMFETPLE